VRSLPSEQFEPKQSGSVSRTEEAFGRPRCREVQAAPIGSGWRGQVVC